MDWIMSSSSVDSVMFSFWFYHHGEFNRRVKRGLPPDFSFLLGLPAILGSGVFEFGNLYKVVEGLFHTVVGICMAFVERIFDWNFTQDSYTIRNLTFCDLSYFTQKVTF